MKKQTTLLLFIFLLSAVTVFGTAWFSSVSYASNTPASGGGSSPAPKNTCGGIQTNIIKCGGSVDTVVWNLLVYIVNFLAIGVGIAAVIGIVFGAITYASAAGNAEQAKKGITRITNVVIGLIAFVFMWAIINFLIPGGLF